MVRSTDVGRWTPLLLIVTALSCSDGSSSTGVGIPATLRAVSPSALSQSAPAGSAATVSPSVVVEDRRGRPVAGVAVTFAVLAGPGSIERLSGITADDGVASAGAWVLGTATGEEKVSARVTGLPPVTFTTRVVAGAPDRVTGAEGDQQSAVPGEPVSIAPQVLVTDPYGNPVPDVRVTFSISAGGGSLEGFESVTDAAGMARVGAWKLGARGINTLDARVDGLQPFTFTAQADPLANAVLAPVTGQQQTATAGGMAPLSPALRVTNADGTPAADAPVRFTVRAGGGSVDAALVMTGPDGVAQLGSWQLGSEPGFNAIGAGIAGLSGQEVMFETIALPADCDGVIELDLAPGELIRHTGGPAATHCLMFELDAVGHEYLVMLENMPRHGAYTVALFPVTSTSPASPTVLDFTLRSISAADRGSSNLAARTMSVRSPPAMQHSWDFGDGPIFEYEPPEPAGPVSRALLRAVDGSMIEINSAAADPQVGDTIHNIKLEGISRLNISGSNSNRAVIRHISNELIIAEDVRLPQLTRDGGGVNTPLTQADLVAIATEYANNVRFQSDFLFDGIHNTAVEANSPPRVLAVHTLMHADNVWGYTYSSSSHFAFDFWVLTDGKTRGNSQHPQRLADNLFMHEIAHMRHWGMLQRNGLPVRGNRWLVEGFARFSERMPIAARLLGTTSPARNGNVVLPRNPVFNGSYYRDDVPTFLNAGTPFSGGYQHSSWIFDYFADQVALTGADWLVATRELVIAAGQPDVLDAVVDRWLPGTSFQELITKARIALYTDDLAGAGLPAWTQYHQFQLRESRPAGSQQSSDPRESWPRLVPGQATAITGRVDAGGAVGYVIAGGQAAARAAYTIAGASDANATLSITRIR